jgi:glycosyltransferase involved in cell wall biosynthesis
MKSSSPLVSIIIPCYNYGHYLKVAVDSCIHQTWKNIEIIVVNDGSPDDTKRVAEACIEKYSKFKIRLINQENMGLSASRNNAIALSRGDYILPLDADDLFEPYMVQKCVALLENQREIAIAYTGCRYFGDMDKISDWIRPWNFRLLCDKDILCYASMYRRNVWEFIGGYGLDMAIGYEDWEFWIRAGRHGFSGRLISEPLFLHRIHGKTMHGEAVLHDLELKSKIALKNPDCYSSETLSWAKEIEKSGVTEYIKQNFVWNVAID